MFSIPFLDSKEKTHVDQQKSTNIPFKKKKRKKN